MGIIGKTRALFAMPDPSSQLNSKGKAPAVSNRRWSRIGWTTQEDSLIKELTNKHGKSN